MTRTSFALAALCGPALSSFATAAAVSFVPVTIDSAALADNPALSNARSVDIRVSLLAGETFNSIGIYLPAAANGSFYQHPLGGLVEPDPGLVSLFPALGYDTYIRVPPPATLNPGTPFEGTVASWNEVLLNRAWYAQGAGVTTIVPFSVGRITWFGDAPIGNGRLNFSPGLGFDFPIALPEPSAFAACIALAVAGLRRRRSV